VVYLGGDGGGGSENVGEGVQLLDGRRKKRVGFCRDIRACVGGNQVVHFGHCFFDGVMPGPGKNGEEVVH